MTESSVTIERPTYQDLPGMVEGGRKFFHHSRFDKWGLGYDAEGFARVVLGLIQMPTMLVLIAKDGNDVVGSIAASSFPWLLDPSQLMVQEIWWWVDKEYRGNVGKMLMGGLEAWCKDIGAKHLLMIGLADDRLRRMDKLYGRMGFSPIELQYHKELRWH